MQLSDAARLMVGLTIIVVPTIEFGGYFLLSQIGSSRIIRTSMQRTFYRAGHAHAGVLVLLALIGQLLVDSTGLSEGLQWGVRLGLFFAPMLVSGGFFFAAPREESGPPARFIVLIYAGALLLALSLVGLGLGLLFP
jgi:hypothetical protein